jgi:predicted TIM-barrel fold metal-dependent hydrolase
MVIDFHTHIFPRRFREKRNALFSQEPAFEALYRSATSRIAGSEELLQTMEEQGVQRSVVFGFPWEKKEHFRRHNDYIVDSVLKHPDKLIGFCCFSPLSPHGPEEARRCLDAGLAGVGELAVYQSGFSKEIIANLREVMEICAERSVPVLLHTNEPVGHVYPGKTPVRLSEIYDLVKHYPSNKIVLAHWGGGLLFYSLMKKEVREVLKNVWFDTAASPYLYVPDMYRVAGELLGFEKVLFGSDYPLLNPDKYFREMKEAGLTPKALGMVKGKNAERLLSRTQENSAHDRPGRTK